MVKVTIDFSDESYLRLVEIADAIDKLGIIENGFPRWEIELFEAIDKRLKENLK